MDDFMKSLTISSVLLVAWTGYLFWLFDYGTGVLHTPVSDIDIVLFVLAECVGILVWVLYIVGELRESEFADDEM